MPKLNQNDTPSLKQEGQTTIRQLPVNQEELQPSINMGIIGHVAHGKSTLVHQMTGVKTAKFNKELEKNMTIKLGYANVKIWNCTCQPDRYTSTDSKKMIGQVLCPHCKEKMTLIRHLSFVDCPGHDILMATMLNGAAVMDAALLVIAANHPCPQPQTQEHLVAASMMGLQNYLVLQNKVDLVQETRAIESHREISAFLQNTHAAKSPVIPISAQQGINVDILCKSIAHMNIPKRDINSSPHMIVVRSFDVNKPGEEDISNLKGGVAGGSLLRGTLSIGDEIEMRPGKVLKFSDGKFKCFPLKSKVVTLFSDQNPLEIATPGGLIAVGTKLDPSLARGDGLKGQVIGIPGSMPPVFSSIEISYVPMKRAVGVDEKEDTQNLAEKKSTLRLKKGEVVRLNVGSATVDALVVATKVDLAKLNLKTPCCAEMHSKLSVSKDIQQGRWRLVGVGLIQAGVETPVGDISSFK